MECHGHPPVCDGQLRSLFLQQVGRGHSTGRRQRNGTIRCVPFAFVPSQYAGILKLLRSLHRFTDHVGRIDGKQRLVCQHTGYHHRPVIQLIRRGYHVLCCEGTDMGQQAVGRRMHAVVGNGGQDGSRLLYSRLSNVQSSGKWSEGNSPPRLTVRISARTGRSAP